MEGADLVVVLDSDIPWIEALHAPEPAARVVHVGPDPLFRRMPVRGYRADLAVAADPVSAIEALAATLPPPAERERERAQRVSARAGARSTSAETSAGRITVELLSRCVSDVMDETAIAVTELGVVPGAMRLRGQNRLFSNPHSGGLGWALPAALGVQLADRDRLVIAAVGDGSYIFANPVACHQVAEAMRLPIMTVIRNNGMWNAVRRSVLRAYPRGAAATANAMPLTDLAPQPDFAAVARGEPCHVERVGSAAELPAALARAAKVIREERRQALVDVRVALSDTA